MKKGDIVAANTTGVSYDKNATGEVLKVCGGAAEGKAVVRFSSGWMYCRDQLVTVANFRIIPKA